MDLTFYQWVQHSYLPCVMVAASQAVDAACSKNGLSFAELLKPLGLSPDIVNGLK